MVARDDVRGVRGARDLRVAGPIACLIVRRLAQEEQRQADEQRGGEHEHPRPRAEGRESSAALGPHAPLMRARDRKSTAGAAGICHEFEVGMPTRMMSMCNGLISL